MNSSDIPMEKEHKHNIPLSFGCRDHLRQRFKYNTVPESYSHIELHVCPRARFAKDVSYLIICPKYHHRQGLGGDQHIIKGLGLAGSG
jgi:hypothetical protein